MNRFNRNVIYILTALFIFNFTPQHEFILEMSKTYNLNETYFQIAGLLIIILYFYLIEKLVKITYNILHNRILLQAKFMIKKHNKDKALFLIKLNMLISDIYTWFNAVYSFEDEKTKDEKFKSNMKTSYKKEIKEFIMLLVFILFVFFVIYFMNNDDTTAYNLIKKLVNSISNSNIKISSVFKWLGIPAILMIIKSIISIILNSKNESINVIENKNAECEQVINNKVIDLYHNLKISLNDVIDNLSNLINSHKNQDLDEYYTEYKNLKEVEAKDVYSTNLFLKTEVYKSIINGEIIIDSINDICEDTNYNWVIEYYRNNKILNEFNNLIYMNINRKNEQVLQILFNTKEVVRNENNKYSFILDGSLNELLYLSLEFLYNIILFVDSCDSLIRKGNNKSKLKILYDIIDSLHKK